MDVYLTWGEPPAQVAEKIAWIRGLAAKEGRTLRFGIRLHVITRDTSEEAWAEANRLLEGFDSETVKSVQAGLARSESEGQQRMLALHGGSRDGLEIHPNLWAGIGLVRGGAGTALVGSHEEVAERIKEYAALGIEEFVLSGYPHLEEAYWFGRACCRGWRRTGCGSTPSASGRPPPHRCRSPVDGYRPRPNSPPLGRCCWACGQNQCRQCGARSVRKRASARAAASGPWARMCPARTSVLGAVPPR